MKFWLIVLGFNDDLCMLCSSDEERVADEELEHL
jgi:hypothetical protein